MDKEFFEFIKNNLTIDVCEKRSYHHSEYNVIKPRNNKTAKLNGDLNV